jgi:hypothetical protein
MSSFASHPGIESAAYVPDDKHLAGDVKDAEDAYVTEVDKGAERDIHVDPNTLLRE